MTLPRVLSAAGRTFAVLGVIMLLFVAFELWGTGIQQAQAQGNLEGELAERLRQAAAAGQGSAPAQEPTGRDGDAGAGAASETPPADGDSEATARDGDRTGEGPTGEGPTGEGPTMGAGRERDATAATDSAGGASAGDSATGAPVPASLPEYPSLPRVVDDISETATARSVARLLHPTVESMLPLVYPESGEAIARVIIPAIELDEIVVTGIGVEDLRKGPGHYGTTPLPGQPGNAAIAGHRTTHGAPFGRIAELAPRDEIIVETLQGRFVYRVAPGSAVAGRSLGHRIVAPTALEVLDDHGDNRLTLTSCHPKYSSRQRIIVHATLVGDPVVRLPRPGEPIGAEFVQLAAPADPPQGEAEVANPDAGTSDGRATPEPDAEPAVDEDAAAAPESPAVDPAAPSDSETTTAATAAVPAPVTEPAPAPVTEEGFGEGLSGDRDAVGPAVLWGLAAAAVWALGWVFGRSGRRLRAYAIAAAPFLVVLYVTFSYIDRALPAY